MCCSHHFIQKFPSGLCLNVDMSVCMYPSARILSTKFMNSHSRFFHLFICCNSKFTNNKQVVHLGGNARSLMTAVLSMSLFIVIIYTSQPPCMYALFSKFFCTHIHTCTHSW